MRQKRLYPVTSCNAGQATSSSTFAVLQAEDAAAARTASGSRLLRDRKVDLGNSSTYNDGNLTALTNKRLEIKNSVTNLNFCSNSVKESTRSTITTIY